MATDIMIEVLHIALALTGDIDIPHLAHGAAAIAADFDLPRCQWPSQ